MEKMFFYDIMLLYKKYEEYVKEENKQQGEYESYSEQYESKMNDLSDMKNTISNMSYNDFGNMDKIVKGFTSGMDL